MLSDLFLKKGYSSSRDNLLEDFYIPVLKESVTYKRTTGFFNSYSLVEAAKGLAYFYANNGKCQLISGVQLSKSDYEAIDAGIKKIDDSIVEKFNMDAYGTFNRIQKNHFKFLSWLISTRRMEIKIAIVKDRSFAIYHEKMGILTDTAGNELTFVGSVNETGAGWARNIEQFKVFRSWIPDEKEYLVLDNQRFQDYWDGKNSKVLVLNLPDAIKDSLIKIEPNDKKVPELIREIKESDRTIKTEDSLRYELKEERKPLRDYQVEAISVWTNANKRGIFAMATGTGKTLAALGAANVLAQKNDLFLVVGVPLGHLVSQWIQDIEIELPEFRIIKVYSKNPNWRNQLKEALSNYGDNLEKKIAVIGTYDSISSNSFIEIFNTRKPPSSKEVMVIADEMHNFGANDSRKGMLEIYTARLGLSATPKRYFDEEGTDLLFNYFGDIVFELDIKEAIKKKYLTPYDYFPKFVYLNDEEIEKYHAITFQMNRFFNKNNSEQSQIYFKLAIKRARILKKAANKIEELDEILKGLKEKEDINHLLIYCEDMDQLSKSQEIVDKYHLITHKFTGVEALADRKKILNNFDEKNYNALLAIKCLDEGVNVPSTQKAIFMASSGNNREYIQRRGRVLRKSEATGKTKAEIFDLIVLPPTDSIDQISKKIVKSEFTRLKEFADCANNFAEIIDSIFDTMKKYRVYL